VVGGIASRWAISDKYRQGGGYPPNIGAATDHSLLLPRRALCGT